jgi:hypothetical protein
MIMLCHVEQWSIRISQVKYNPIAILCYRYIFWGGGCRLTITCRLMYLWTGTWNQPLGWILHVTLLKQLRSF